MRHFLARLVTILIIAILVIGSIGFAWLRSEQFVIARRMETEPIIEQTIATAADFDWQDFGDQVYVANCRNCHMPDGSGRGMYPSIKNMSVHLQADGGHEYLIDLVLYGLHTGQHDAPMPPMPNLSDRQIAAVNNYMLTQFAQDAPTPPSSRLFIPDDVRRRRGTKLSASEVASKRPQVPFEPE